MKDLLKNKKIIAIVGLVIMAIIVAAIAIFIISSQSEPLIKKVFITPFP